MRTERMSQKDRERFWEAGYLVLIGLFLFAWAVIQPIEFSPDEQMRYRVVDYIFRHNALPHGGDPEVLDPSWGISYAFYPMLSYMVSYVFMKLVSIFTNNSHAILVAARMAEVSFGVGTAYFTMKIAKRAFDGPYRRMFVCLVTLLPGAFVLFTYVNCDGLSLLATAMLIYAWVLGLTDGWSKRTCLFTGVGVSVCALSYYNAYGVILATIVVFVLSILFCGEKRWNFKKMFARGLLITGVFVSLAGWWFVRNYLLYDGDVLALDVTTEYAEKYAEEARKPSNSYTFQENPNVNVIDMLYYQAVNHPHNWTMMVYYSFIGAFGYMNFWLPEWIGKVFMVFFLIGLLGVLMQLRRLFYLRKTFFDEEKLLCGKKVKVRFFYRPDRWQKQGVFHIGMMITLIIPNLLNIYNSYVQDYQPQGRYSMPMLIPLMYFMTLGYRRLFGKSEKGQKAAKIFCLTVCICMAALIIYSYFGQMIPGCRSVWIRMMKRLAREGSL